jgi:hypothetical protein
MKKFITSILFLALGVLMFSQTATTGPYAYPRFGTSTGTTVSSGNTGANLNFRNVKKTCSITKVDTLNLSPLAWESHINVAALDTLVVQISSAVNNYEGDKLVVYATGTATTNYLKFVGTSFQANPDTISCGGSFKCYIAFVWDGVKYIETARKRY